MASELVRLPLCHFFSLLQIPSLCLYVASVVSVVDRSCCICLGTGTLLLNHILEQCEKDKTVKSVFLHVQINNDDAVKFYQKQGFTITKTEENYYRRIEPASAHVLEKVIRK